MRRVKNRTSRVKELLDMGAKPVFRVTTASGRKINTTSNHPYLTKDRWVFVSELSEGVEIAVPTEIIRKNKKKKILILTNMTRIQSIPWL